ncbi:beta-propeller domain-containing protein [Ideonella sp. BN130291]|uniref:beta-propeller domain-containing protein n=1 Tax=Ideonella sp. BN130291 TaxID=3112940 RepID=UPI002E253F5D|nr:beta-propeller domain-containing protein [Ideonella sp. BN130291]
MPTRRWLLCSLLFTLGAWAAAPAARADTTLTAYRSEAELRQALERWRDAARKLQPRLRRAEGTTAGLPELAMQAAPPAPANVAAAPAAKAAADSAAESITNVQTAGVDEGGIVKRAGDHLVILRRGRLFSVRVGGDSLQPVGMVDAYAPGSSPQGAWYDELLISGRTVVVIGYSYARGGTEIGLFDLAHDGHLSYRATYHLRSFDYYSSRNYASRLIGSQLVFYTPVLLQPWGPAPWDTWPGMKRWQGDAVPAAWQRLLPATRVYRSDDEFDPAEPLALHTVTACNLASAPLQCESSAVLGPAGRVFYVSAGSVYVWTNRGYRGARRPLPGSRTLSAVFRLPLDGGAPSGLKTAGVPVDQMSFLEDGGHLNVLLREAGGGEGMWSSEDSSAGAMALLRVPLSEFGDGRAAAGPRHYRRVPAPAGGALQNRYVGDWLLWGGGQAGWALRFADDQPAQPLSPGHTIERIDAMGPHAVLVGSNGQDLHFSSVRLDRRAELAGRHVQSGASQGETRSHGFFFRPMGTDGGLLGLPVLDSAAGGRGAVYSGGAGAAAVLFLRQRDLAFQPLGRLQALSGDAQNDACEASCVDWYGNARPLFLGDRVFALLGYELVEGTLSGGRWRERIDERRRISFAPGARAGARYSPF